jgi:hypothetical protein
VTVHAQKPDFVFRRKGRVHLNRQGASVQSTTGSRGVHISGSNAGYTTFRGNVKGTGYPLHSPVSPSFSSSVRHRQPSHFNWTLQPVSTIEAATTGPQRYNCITRNGGNIPKSKPVQRLKVVILPLDLTRLWTGNPNKEILTTGKSQNMKPEGLS